MSAGRYIYVSPIWGLIIMTRRFVWHGHVYTERGGELLIGGNPSPRNRAVFMQCQDECIMSISTENEYEFRGLTIAYHVRLIPLTSVLCPDLVRHVGKFLVSGEHGTYILG